MAIVEGTTNFPQAGDGTAGEGWLKPDGFFYHPRMSTSFGIFVTLADLIAGEDQQLDRLKVAHECLSQIITTAATTVVKTGVGGLHTVSVLGGTAGAISIYNNTAGSGTLLVPTFTPGSVTTPFSLHLDLRYTIGLTIVTAAATLLVVSYF